MNNSLIEFQYNYDLIDAYSSYLKLILSLVLHFSTKYIVYLLILYTILAVYYKWKKIPISSRIDDINYSIKKIEYSTYNMEIQIDNMDKRMNSIIKIIRELKKID